MKITDFNTIVFPSNLNSIVKEYGFWETEEYSPFFITVDLIEGSCEEHKELFSFQFNPTSEEFEKLNKKISSMGFDCDGYGWSNFLMREVQKNDSRVMDAFDSDSESETCYLATTSQELFKRLLENLKLVFNNLLL